MHLDLLFGSNDTESAKAYDCKQMNRTTNTTKVGNTTITVSDGTGCYQKQADGSEDDEEHGIRDNNDSQPEDHGHGDEDQIEKEEEERIKMKTIMKK